MPEPLPRGLGFFSPDGSYLEGLSYVDYALRTLLMFINAYQRLHGNIDWTQEINFDGVVDFILAMQAGRHDDGTPDIVNFSDARASVFPCVAGWIERRTGNRVAAVVAYFPPTDLRTMVGPNDRFPALDFDEDGNPLSTTAPRHLDADALPDADPSTLADPLAVGRTIGWIAQWKEMIEDPNQKIGRPRQLYTGPAQREYVPVERR